jgi:hypothetical protein
MPVLQGLVARGTGPARPVAVSLMPGGVTTAQVRAPLDRLRRQLGTEPSASASTRFLAAADALVAHLEQRSPTSLLPRPSAPALSDLKEALVARLDPADTVSQRVKARISFPASSAAKAAPSPAEDAVIMPHPDFPQPMYVALRSLSPDFLLPGAEHVPADTVSLVATNARFVESFMVGLNHEMGRELLWREYPSDQRGTYFTQFWDTAGSASPDAATQLPAIHQWDPTASLGGTFLGGGTADRLVLLVRGELLRRYPGTVIYGVRADSLDDEQPEEAHPIFRGTLEPDIVFVGFNLTEADARGGADGAGYYFVFQEQPGDPRFGLDVPGDFGAAVESLTSWDQLTWGHVVNDAAAFEQLTHVPLAGRLGGRRLEEAEWSLNSAHMARITLQKQVRVAIHASTLLPAIATRLEP